ncbi:MAG: glycosyltransferase family 2 protein [Nitrosopumilaceae archaeon]
MGKLYLTLTVTFAILVLVHIAFVAANLYFWATNGLEFILHGTGFIEAIYYSIFLKWMIFADALWLFFALIFMFKRKHYKTDSALHYLSYRSILNPIICVVLPAYNEELSIEEVVKEYINQKSVKHVIVVDNNSTDRTAEIAERCGAKVIKESNKGYAHACVAGLKESLKTDANIVVLTDCDGTFDAHDIAKMVPFLDNCDMAIGTRQVQVLTQKGNQNSMFYVWGNLFLAKMLQIKYFSLLHMGVVNLTDVGCSYRCIRRDALEKIIDNFNSPSANKVIHDDGGWLFIIFLTMLGIQNDLKIVEVPITFKKRIGVSKSGAQKKNKGIKFGLKFLWYIVSS